MCLCVCLIKRVWLSVNECVWLFIYIHVRLSVCLSLSGWLAGCPCMSVRPPLLSVCLCLSVSLSLHVHLSICLSVCLCLPICPSLYRCMSVFPSVFPSRAYVWSSVCLSAHLSVFLSVCLLCHVQLFVSCLCVCHCVSVSLPVCLPLHVFMSNSVYVCL